jgi:hypothetical protein
VGTRTRVFAALTAGALVAAAAAWTAPSASQRPLLPDLDQSAPWGIAVKGVDGAEGRRFLLVFGSKVENVGSGPLVIVGRRGRRAAWMVARQEVALAGGGVAVGRRIGALSYVRSADHEHWHLLGFDRYELRRADDFTFLVRDRKTGFCLGDRYRIDGAALPRAPREPVFRSQCGLRSPDLLRLRHGISVGYGDPYDPELEGQYLDVTGLPAGDYVLVHRVNANRALRERRYDNDAASALLRLTWPDGAAQVEVLASCPASERCAPSGPN